MIGRPPLSSIGLHIGVIAALAALYVALPVYHQSNLARILVLAIYATGYNLLFGYTGLLSLGHALYLAAGVYGAGLAMQFADTSPGVAFAAGVATAALVALVIGALALRTAGVAFMIVTLMFAQAGYLTIIHFNDFTRGDEGFVVNAIANADTRFVIALALYTCCLVAGLFLVHSNIGRVWRALAGSEARVELLGYSPYRYKLGAFVVSGTMAGIAGAAYAILFGYVGATFASIQYSIFAVLYVLVGGAGVLLGPLVGTAIMFYLVDWIGELTSAWLFFVGLALVLLVSVLPRGLLGSLQYRYRWRWLP